MERLPQPRGDRVPRGGSGDLRASGPDRSRRGAAYHGRGEAHFEGTQLVRCLEGLAELALARGDAAACVRFADELLSLAAPAGLKELAAHARRWHGAALAASGDSAAATAELKLAGAAADQIGRLRLALDAARALEKLDPAGGHAAKAETLAARIRDSVRGTELTGCV